MIRLGKLHEVQCPAVEPGKSFTRAAWHAFALCSVAFGFFLQDCEGIPLKQTCLFLQATAFLEENEMGWSKTIYA